jgi:hypothetical protein
MIFLGGASDRKEVLLLFSTARSAEFRSADNESANGKKVLGVLVKRYPPYN